MTALCREAPILQYSHDDAQRKSSRRRRGREHDDGGHVLIGYLPPDGSTSRQHNALLF